MVILLELEEGAYRFKDKISTMDRLNIMEIAGKMQFAKRYVLDLKGIPEKELVEDSRNMMILYNEILSILYIPKEGTQRVNFLEAICEDSFNKIIADKRIIAIIGKQPVKE
jgi:hypothetical protein